MIWWIALINSVVALITSGFGVAALVKPALFAPKGDTTSRFFPALYAGRAIPLGIAVAIAVWLPSSMAPAVVLILAVATIAQLTDVVVLTRSRQYGPVVGAAFAVVWHVVAIVALAAGWA